ncbi:MAG: hypothetical protein ACI9WU_004511, partial [Myxococcota bacterium]
MKIHALTFAAFLVLAAPSAMAGEVTCSDANGTCTQDNMGVSCDCGDEGGGGGGGGEPIADDQLEPACEQALEDFCGEPDVTTGDGFTCTNDFGSCTVDQGWISCACEGDAGSGGTGGGGSDVGTGGSEPEMTQEELEQWCWDELTMCGDTEPEPGVACENEFGECTVDQWGSWCECIDGSGGGGSGTTSGTSGGQDDAGDSVDGGDSGSSSTTGSGDDGGDDAGDTGFDTGSSGTGSTEPPSDEELMASCIELLTVCDGAEPGNGTEPGTSVGGTEAGTSVGDSEGGSSVGGSTEAGSSVGGVGGEGASDGGGGEGSTVGGDSGTDANGTTAAGTTGEDAGGTTGESTGA